MLQRWQDRLRSRNGSVMLRHIRQETPCSARGDATPPSSGNVKMHYRPGVKRKLERPFDLFDMVTASKDQSPRQ